MTLDEWIIKNLDEWIVFLMLILIMGFLWLIGNAEAAGQVALTAAGAAIGRFKSQR